MGAGAGENDICGQSGGDVRRSLAGAKIDHEHRLAGGTANGVVSRQGPALRVGGVLEIRSRLDNGGLGFSHDRLRVWE